MEIKIDKGIPQVTTRLNGQRARYPWKEMGKDDSFIFPRAGTRDETRRRVSSAISTRRHKYGERYSWAFVHEDGAEVARVWRLNDNEPTG